MFRWTALETSSASLQGDPDQPHLLIFAHMDELGLIVRKIEPDGFLRFERVGGVPGKACSRQQLRSLPRQATVCPAWWGRHSHHVTPAEAKFTVPSRLEMYVDVGCATSEEVQELGIQVGDMIAYRPGMIRLAGQRVASKTLDNRIGCLQLIKVLEALAANRPKATVHLAASVQEEFNVRGVWPVFQKYHPDAAICIDVTIACDTPELTHLSGMKLGGGPAVGLYEFHGRGTLGGLIPNPFLRRFIENTARQHAIPLRARGVDRHHYRCCLQPAPRPGGRAHSFSGSPDPVHPRPARGGRFIRYRGLD